MRNPAQIAVGEAGFLPPGRCGRRAAVLDVLEGAGYSGWYVLEQDTEPKEGVGPVLDVGKNLAFVEKRKD
jgi:hypothetical protein